MAKQNRQLQHEDVAKILGKYLAEAKKRAAKEHLNDYRIPLNQRDRKSGILAVRLDRIIKDFDTGKSTAIPRFVNKLLQQQGYEYDVESFEYSLLLREFRQALKWIINYKIDLIYQRCSDEYSIDLNGPSKGEKHNSPHLSVKITSDDQDILRDDYQFLNRTISEFKNSIDQLTEIVPVFKESKLKETVKMEQEEMSEYFLNKVVSDRNKKQ